MKYLFKNVQVIMIIMHNFQLNRLKSQIIYHLKLNR